MTPKQQTFIAEYLVGKNATRAAIRARHNKPGDYLVHSSFVSDVELYQAKGKGIALKQPASGLSTRARSAATPFDTKLAQWLETGNPDTVSKVVDENRDLSGETAKEQALILHRRKTA